MKPPTLIDALYKMTFRPEPVSNWQSNIEMRHAIEAARNHRFVADERMSGFMAELANAAFMKVGLKHQSPLNNRIADSLRVQSRLPHETIWIEYNLREYQRRSFELRQPGGYYDPKENPLYEGWLIQQHPKIDTACIMHLFTHSDDADMKGYHYWTFPFAFGWCCDDSPLPWRLSVPGFVTDSKKSVHSATILAGLHGYTRDNVGLVLSPLICNPARGKGMADVYADLMREWTGTIRRVWALLATIDNLPLAYGQVRQSKGFLARGRIRKFLDHKTITLNIPAKKDTRVIARKAIAVAHRARHEVRGHWRNDWRHPPSSRCNPHLWESVDEGADHIVCALCSGRQVYVHKHERGDASLGYVTHDYKLKHETVR